MEQVNHDRDTPSGQSRKREVQHTRNQNRRIVKLRVEQVALVRRISTKEESHGGCPRIDVWLGNYPGQNTVKFARQYRARCHRMRQTRSNLVHLRDYRPVPLFIMTGTRSFFFFFSFPFLFFLFRPLPGKENGVSRHNVVISWLVEKSVCRTVSFHNHLEDDSRLYREWCTNRSRVTATMVTTRTCARSISHSSGNSCSHVAGCVL